MEFADLAIMFLQNANISYHPGAEGDRSNRLAEPQFLDNQFVCIYKKIKKGAKNSYTFAKIYYLKLAKEKPRGNYELDQPIIDIK